MSALSSHLFLSLNCDTIADNTKRITEEALTQLKEATGLLVFSRLPIKLVLKVAQKEKIVPTS